MMPVMLDVLLVAVIVLFAFLGAKRGFVLTLCSLCAVIVAFVGAKVLSAAAAPAVAGFLQPRLEETIQLALEERSETAGGLLSVQDTLEALEDAGGVFAWAAGAAAQALHGIGTDTIARLSATAAAAVAGQAARGIVFPAAFLLLLLLWGVVSRALNLVARLPVLHSLNTLLGAAVGALKGLILAAIAVWVLCDLSGVISVDMVRETKLLSLFAGHAAGVLFH